MILSIPQGLFSSPLLINFHQLIKNKRALILQSGLNNVLNIDNHHFFTKILYVNYEIVFISTYTELILTLVTFSLKMKLLLCQIIMF